MRKFIMYAMSAGFFFVGLGLALSGYVAEPGVAVEDPIGGLIIGGMIATAGLVLFFRARSPSRRGPAMEAEDAVPAGAAAAMARPDDGGPNTGASGGDGGPDNGDDDTD
jgi:hypothetical protein